MTLNTPGEKDREAFEGPPQLADQSFVDRVKTAVDTLTPFNVDKAAWAVLEGHPEVYGPEIMDLEGLEPPDVILDPDLEKEIEALETAPVPDTFVQLNNGKGKTHQMMVTAIARASQGDRVMLVIGRMGRDSLLDMAKRIIGSPSNNHIAIDLSGITYASGGAVDFVDFQDEHRYTSVFNYALRLEDHAIADRKAKRQREMETREALESEDLDVEEVVDPTYPTSGFGSPPFGDDDGEDFSAEDFDS